MPQKKKKAKVKSKAQIGLLMSNGSPLTPEQKKKLEKELKKGNVRVRGNAKKKQQQKKKGGKKK